MTERMPLSVLRGSLIFVVLTACQDGALKMPTEDESPAIATLQYRVVIDRTPWEGSTVESRREAEQEAIDAVVLRTPPIHQARVRELLTAQVPGRFIGFGPSSDPEIARLFGIIQSIRAADAHDRGIVSTPPDLRPRRKLLHVLVALVPDLGRADVRATVVRRPDDKGRPTLLLREADATPADMIMGMRGAVLSFKRHGRAPDRDRSLHLRAGRDSRAAHSKSESAASSIELIRSQPARNIPGLGNVRAVEFVTDLDPPATP